MPHESVVRRCRLKRSDIWYLHFIFEAYDGIGTVSTVVPSEGIVEIRMPASRREEGERLLEALSGEIELSAA